MTQEQVATEVERLAWATQGRRVGVNADMVSKWERQTKQPSRFYGDLLALVFQDQMPAHGGRTDHDGLRHLPTTIELLTALGPSGFLVQREMLQQLPGGSGGASSRRAQWPTGADTDERPDAAKLDQAEQLAHRYQELYPTFEPAGLLRALTAHLTVAADLLVDVRSPNEVRRLHTNTAQVALLAGRIALFDLKDAMVARAHFDLSIESAMEAHRPLLGATAMGHAGFVAAEAGRCDVAVHYLRTATERSTSSALIQAWLAAVESEIQSKAGQSALAAQALERARRLLSESVPSQTPVWFDFFDKARLAGFEGFAMLVAGDTDAAARVLITATAALPADATKQRAVYLADLATVRVREGDVDEGCRLASSAADALDQADYATGWERLRQFRLLVDPWRTHPGVRQLDERLGD